MQINMNSCLKSLQSSLAAVAKKVSDDADAALQLQASSKLVNFLLAQYGSADLKKQEMYKEVSQLIPTIQEVLGAGRSEVLTELKQLSEKADAAAFEQFLQALQAVSLQLLKTGSDAANALAGKLVALEANYSVFLMQALTEETKKAANIVTSTARNTKEFDKAALQAFLKAAFPEEKELTLEESDFITGGSSKFTLKLGLGGVRTIPEKLILRADAAGMYGGANTIDEYRLLKVLSDNGASVPQPLAVEESGKVFGSPFFVMERAAGAPLCAGFLPPEPNKKACENIAVSLARLHKIPIEQFSGSFTSKYPGNSAKVLSWLDEGYNAWQPLDMPSPSFQTAYEWLRANVSLMDKAPRTMVHGDFSLHNMLVEGEKLTAILDWEFADFGNPAYDLGYFHYMAEGLSSWEHFLSCYEKGGMPIPDEDQLNYCCLLAVTRLGTMTLQSVAVFNAGKDTGTVLSIVMGDDYYGETIRRLNQWLDKVIK